MNVAKEWSCINELKWKGWRRLSKGEGKLVIEAKKKVDKWRSFKSGGGWFL